MREQPLVSIIVPVYNVSAYLEEALDSLISQTYKNIEIIIIDDGSKDNSGKICDEYAAKDNRIKLIHKENGGLSAARNTALEIFSGDYITYVDSDDAVVPSYVETMLNTIERDGSDIVLCRFDEQRTNKNFSPELSERILPVVDSGKYDHAEILRILFDGKVNTAVFNKFYKRYIWEELRFPAGHVYEDVEVAYKTFDMCKSITIIDDVLYHQRIRPGSITATFSIKNIKDQMLAQSKIEAFVKANTPTVYPEATLAKLERLHFELLLKSYVRLAIIRGNSGEKTELKASLRREIIEIGDTFDLRRISFSKRLIYLQIVNFPFLLDVSAPASVRLKAFKNKIKNGLGSAARFKLG